MTRHFPLLGINPDVPFPAPGTTLPAAAPQSHWPGWDWPLIDTRLETLYLERPGAISWSCEHFLRLLAPLLALEPPCPACAYG